MDIEKVYFLVNNTLRLRTGDRYRGQTLPPGDSHRALPTNIDKQ